MEKDYAADELAARVKEAAARQPLTIELTEEQLTNLRAIWDEADPTAPAQITFMVKDKPIAEIAVAGYRYRGNTCCV